MQPCETGPLSLPYRIVVKGFGGADPSSASCGREGDLLDHLFPFSFTLVIDWSSTPLDLTLLSETVPEFMLAELNAAARRLPSGKGSGFRWGT